MCIDSGNLLFFDTDRRVETGDKKSGTTPTSSSSSYSSNAFPSHPNTGVYVHVKTKAKGTNPSVKWGYCGENKGVTDCSFSRSAVVLASTHRDG